MKKFSLQQMTMIAFLAALLSASAFIVIPLPFSPVALTAQTLVVNLIGFVLGPLEALTVICIYILLGLCGVPVFSGGMGGPAKLFGPTGGYIMAWLVAVVVISLLKGKKYHFVRYSLVAVMVAFVIIYGGGTAYFKFQAGVSWQAALTAAVYPFIPLDMVKCIAAAAIAKPVQRAVGQLQGKRQGEVHI